MLNILMYHEIYQDEKKDNNTHSLSVSNFRDQMQILKNKDVILVEDIGDIPNHNNNYYAVTFDDGKDSDYKIAFEILKEYNIKATFYIIANKINTEGYLSEKEILEMHDFGMNIGSHSFSHAKLSLLNKDELYDELLNSKKVLEDIINNKITSISVPGGFYNNEVISVAKEIGYKIILTSDIGINNLNSTILKRNAIKESMNFSKVLNSNLYLKIFALRYSLLKIMKKSIGNENYENIKTILRKAVKL